MSGYKERVAKRRSERVRERVYTPRTVHVCDEKCEHYRSPLELSLREKFIAILKAELPPGTRAVVDGPCYLDVQIVCGGNVAVMGYFCVMKPHHTGQCYSSNKQHHFTPESFS